jgi:transposase
VFFVDAAHFVWGAFMSVLWCVTRVWIKAPSGRQRFNVLGALNAVTQEVITVVNALTPQGPITVVLDNARYQRCALVQTHAAQRHIELLFLPAYSPNLNLIERLWKFVKKQCLYAKHYPDFGTFTNAIQRCLHETHTLHKEALSSLLTLNFQAFEKAHL